MKKNLLLWAVAMFSGATAFAQAVVINGEALGLTSNLTKVAAGTAIGSNDGIELSFAFDDSYKVSNLKANDYTSFIFNGDSIPTSYGVQGNANPADESGQAPNKLLGAPVSGTVLQLNAKQDGYVVVWGKLTSNKSYTVFKNGQAIGYRLVMQTNSVGLIDVEVAGEGADNVVTTAPINTPIALFNGGATAENGLGVIYFPVSAHATYLVNACGGKLTTGGAYFSATDDINVAIAGEGKESIQLLKAADSETSISSITSVAHVASIQMYNVSGQEISGLAKGVNIVKRTLTDGSVQCVKVLNK
jgi:hypothetical protein